MKLFWQRYGYWIKVGMSAGLLLLLLLTIDFKSVLMHISKLPVWFFVIAVLLNATILVVATIRWWLLLPGEKFRRLLRITFGSQHLAFLLPSSLTNDAIRLVTTRYDAGGVGHSLVVIAWDKVLGLIAIMVLMGPSTWYIIPDLGRFDKGTIAGLGYTVFFIGCLALTITFTKKGSKLIVLLMDWLFHIIPISFISTRNVISSMQTATMNVASMTKRKFWSFVLALLYQLLIASGYVLVASVFNQPMSWSQAIWASSAMQVIMMLPLGIAGIGLKDVSLLLVLTNFGFSPELAMAASLSSYPVVVIFAIAGWSITASTSWEPRKT